MQKIVLASNNQGKIKELKQLLQHFSSDIIPQQEFAIPEIDETGLTFVENALLKARHASQMAKLPAIADDSGVVIDALNGAPGIYSARYAGEHGNMTANITKVLKELKNVPEAQRTARFVCCLVYLQHAEDPLPIICFGTLEGMITTERKGDHGFGYDPILWLPDHQCTVAELTAERKNQISHRAQAMRLLQNYLMTPQAKRAPPPPSFCGTSA